jgi:polar amino acid transport system permease protein
MAYIAKVLPLLLEGTKMTLALWTWTLVLSLPLGFLVTLAVRSRIWPIRWLMEIYIYVMRGTPLMLQLMFVYYGLPFIPIVGPYMTFSRLSAAIFAFALNYAAYFAEIFRGGFLAVPKGQFEACQVLSLNRFQTMTRVVIPQMIRVALPAVTNETITLVKDTSLAYVIALAELMHGAKATVSRDSSPMAYVYAGVIYLIIVFVVTLIFKKLEAHYRIQEK